MNFLPLGLKSCGPLFPVLDFAASTGTAYRGWSEGHCYCFRYLGLVTPGPRLASVFYENRNIHHSSSLAIFDNL